MRTGAEYLRSLNDGRQVFLDGERVKDVTAHRAFREAARSAARLYDIAAAPEMRGMGLADRLKGLFGGGPRTRSDILPTAHQQGDSHGSQ